MSKIPTIAMIPSGYKANKLYSVLPTNGDADLAFTRAGEASRINQLSLQETLLTGVPRLDYTDGGCPSLLVEPARKNLFLNSETGATQTITVVSGVDYAVSFSGTGSITFSGGATGTLNGTGANAVDRVSSIITTTTTSVTCTISGTVEYVNFEINTNDSSVSYATSWIETTGTIATRVAETVSKTGLESIGAISSTEFTIVLELKEFNVVTGIGSISANDRFLGTNTDDYIAIFPDGRPYINESPFFFSGVSQGLKYAIRNENTNEYTAFVDGVKGSTIIGTGNRPDRFSIGENGLRNMWNIASLKVYNEALSDNEIINLTTL